MTTVLPTHTFYLNVYFFAFTLMSLYKSIQTNIESPPWSRHKGPVRENPTPLNACVPLGQSAHAARFALSVRGMALFVQVAVQ